MSKNEVQEHRYQAVGGRRLIDDRVIATYSTWLSGLKDLLVIETDKQSSLAAQGIAGALGLLALAGPFLAGYPDCTQVAEGIAFYYFFVAMLASLGLFVEGIRDRIGFFTAFFAPASVVTSIFYIIVWAGICHA